MQFSAAMGNVVFENFCMFAFFGAAHIKLNAKQRAWKIKIKLFTYLEKNIIKEITLSLQIILH